MILSTPITDISGVGAATARKLQKMDIQRVADLLFYFPFRLSVPS
jgi:ATP-dependent DNA helicase RecG